MSDPPKVPFIGVVAEDFEGIDEDELTLSTGTKCVVVSCEEDGWWIIHTKNNIGIFPGSYIDVIEKITLPCYGELVKEVPEINGKTGTIVIISQINEDYWIIEYNNKKINCTWDYLNFTNKKPEQKKLLTPNSSQVNKPQRKLIVDSVIDFEPLMVEDLDTVQELSSSNFKNNSTTNNNKQRVSSSSGYKNNNKPISFAEPVKTNNNNNNNAKPQRINKPVTKGARTSTYKRPVSIFGKFEINSAFEVVFEKDKYNIYDMPDNNRPKFEQEGRWEFRASCDIPPPPSFTGIEKSYVTANPSFIDFEAKERSAVFDI